MLIFVEPLLTSQYLHKGANCREPRVAALCRFNCNTLGVDFPWGRETQTCRFSLTGMAAGPAWQLPTGRLDHLYRHLFRVSDTDYGSILRRKPSEILSVLIFSGQKPCTRIYNLCNIAFFFKFFKGYGYNWLSVITPKTIICHGSLRK